MTVSEGAGGTAGPHDVYEVIGRVLRRDDLAPELDFFQLGGTSLAAMQIVTLLEDSFGVRISLTDLFDAPDLAGIAELVEREAER